MGDIGAFSGLFGLDSSRYKEPVLVSSTDGVGTKLKIAQAMDVHNSIGIDLVAMVVNDLIVTGAEPLFFLDYLSIGKVKPKKVAEIIKGIAEGCRTAGCALIGGETAEHPGVMEDDDYDLAGFAVGVIEKEKIIDGQNSKEGDSLIALASNGLHSNGFSFVRKLFNTEDEEKLGQKISKLDKTLGEELLRPTKIYVGIIQQMIKEDLPIGIAHITGGGLMENISRIIPDTLDAVIDRGSWNIPPIFQLIQEHGNVDDDEMFRTFNMGIGMIITVSKTNESKALELLGKLGETAFACGQLEQGSKKVRF